MGVAFLVSFINGFDKFMFLMLMSGLMDLVLPLVLMRDIHNYAGLARGFFVAAHLVLNRARIITMTKKSQMVQHYRPDAKSKKYIYNCTKKK